MTSATAAVMEQTQTYTGKGVAPPAKGHHFLHIDDFSKEELQAMLKTSMEVRFMTSPARTSHSVQGITSLCA